MSHKFRTLTVAAIAVVILVAPPRIATSQEAPATPPAPLSSSDAYVVGAEDILSVMVWNRPELSGKFPVDSQGAVQLPLIERVSVRGLTVRAIELEIKKRLADGYINNPQVMVLVEQYRSQKVFVQGAVAKAGEYPLTGATTLLEVLTRAGSTTAEAGDELLIIRASDQSAKAHALLPESADAAEIQRVNISALLKGTSDHNLTLRAGDTVFVPLGEKVYITGQVRTPNAYTIRSNMTVLQALTLAGGVTERGADNRIKIRRIVNGKQREIGVGLDDRVEPGDTIVVPERFF
jgi:polysaccharide export outer membrane protein